MNRTRPFCALALFFCFFLPGGTSAQTGALPAASIHLASAASAEKSDVPQEMQDLMRCARQHYLEGSTLIKSGDSAKAPSPSTRKSRVSC